MWRETEGSSRPESPFNWVNLPLHGAVDGMASRFDPLAADRPNRSRDHGSLTAGRHLAGSVIRGVTG
jgi:hypothetical protein